MSEKMEWPGSLHNHTDYSNIRLRDSINKIDTLLDYAGQLGHKVIAITEHECLSNAIKIEDAANKIKDKYPDLKVIRGNEIYLCRNGLNNKNFVRGVDKYYHFILLAIDGIGHQQIRQISTNAWTRSYMNGRMRRVPTYYQDLFDIIGKNKGHVIGSTACLGGALPTQLLKYRETKDEKLYQKICLWVKQLDSIFGHGYFFFELQPSASNEQKYVNRKLIELSAELDIPYIITTDSHYLKESDKSIHKSYLNSQNGEREVDDFYATTYVMTTKELEGFLELTEDELNTAYTNIMKIRDMCQDYTLKKPLKIPTLTWKKFNTEVNLDEWFDRIPMLQTFYHSDYEGDKQLVYAVIDGINSHNDLTNEQAYREINSNLEMTWESSQVNKAHWSAYYLNLQRIIDLCWEAGSLVGPGRGSGVGFILLYVLGITQINPLRESTKTFSWRFLNPSRVSVLDVDFDIEGRKRADVLKKFRQVYGDQRVSNVATFRTEKSKSAILTAARGLGIDVDVAQYIASLIPSDRGMLRTLDQCFYGDEENAPIKQFVVEMTDNYPELWSVAHSIEGLISGSGLHAGGIIFTDEDFTNSTALMRAPDGTLCTQFELHDCEAASLIKYDALSVEAMDKIHICLDLLCDEHYIEREDTLKATYEKIIGIYNLDRTNSDMWRMVHNHEIQSLFQMEQPSGIQGIKTLKPTTVDELAILNSTIRLMAQEKGGEMPTDKLARFKRNPRAWIEEMNQYGLSAKEKEILKPILSISYGLCIAQEQFMELVQLPELGGFSLTWADKLRKSIAKKNPAEYEKLTEEFYRITKEKGISQQFAHYVWDVLIAMSKGYGFNQSHTLAYSLIALQEMNLAHRYPIMFWNCACLISNTGAEQEETEEEDNIILEEYDNIVEEFSEEDEDDDDDETGVILLDKTKKKTKTVDYDKVAKAIGQIKSTGVTVAPPNINKSSYNFSPDIENNTILYGISGITRIGTELVQSIINNRPYTSIVDFLDKVKVNKIQMVNLIKSGAFDGFGDRIELMKEYISLISNPKTKLNLINMPTLIKAQALPESLQYEIKVYNFNKYLRKHKLDDNYLILDEVSLPFYETNFDYDLVCTVENKLCVPTKKWDAIYQKIMDTVRNYIKDNQEALLSKVNAEGFQTLWDKYCGGTISKWEMDSISFYQHEHELESVNNSIYHFADFFKMPTEPVIEKTYRIKGKEVPIYKTYRFAGTVLSKDKNKGLITLLTTTGVVSIRIYKTQFAEYDKQISIKLPDGKKKVVEKSWFTRGNKLVVNGYRRDNEIVLKKYKGCPFAIISKITDIYDNGEILYTTERFAV